MIKVKIEKIPLSKIKPNPDNPRTITKKEMNQLIQSLRDFPEMLQLREIIIDETMMILGGNMRYAALKKLRETECVAKIVTGLTEEQKREFVVKDNGSWGQWDFDALANTWSELPLVNWGIKIPADWSADNNQIGDMRKNFTANVGGQDDDEEPAAIGVDGKYPITFILEKQEWEKWEAVKEKLKIKQDKAAFLKIIGGA